MHQLAQRGRGGGPARAGRVRRRSPIAWTAAALALLGLAAPGRAQQGSVAGVVVAAGSARPIAGAQVVVEGTGRGAVTDVNGRFHISGLSGGEVTLRVIMIGYRTVTVPARVGDAAIRVALTEAAVELDQIVVTGTVGGTQRRQLGNSVARITAADVVASAPVQSMQDLLNGRAAGVVVMPGTGMVGSGSRIRIRGGLSTLSLSNDPLIYVDGVRVNNETGTGFAVQAFGSGVVARLNDFNPDEIESIEIIKGPAAATLYGTEASNGVIQIITRRGQAGRPRLDMSFQLGTNWLVNPEGRTALRWWRDESGELRSVNIYEYERDRRGGPIFTNGLLQGYAVSLSGGTPNLRYFTSASYDHDVGVVPWNWDKRSSGRLNLDVVPSERVSARLGLSVIHRSSRLAQANFDSDPMSNLIWPQPRTLE